VDQLLAAEQPHECGESNRTAPVPVRDVHFFRLVMMTNRRSVG